MPPEEGVVDGDVYWEALRMENQPTNRGRTVLSAALNSWRVAIVEPEQGCVGEVVIHKLAPLHHIVCLQLTGGVHVWNDVYAD